MLDNGDWAFNIAAFGKVNAPTDKVNQEHGILFFCQTLVVLFKH